MYAFKINSNRDEMAIFLKGKLVYRAGYHASMNNIQTNQAFDDHVSRLKTQLI